MTPNVKGALLALGAFGIFASHDVIVKVLGGTYNSFQIVFFSVLFGFPLLTLRLIQDTTIGHLRPIHPWWTALRTIAAVITGGSAFYAISTLPLTQVYAILFAAPLLITILAIPILGESVRLRRWMAVIVGLLGVLVVLRPGSVPLTLGHLAALVAAVCGALSSIIVRKIGRDERAVVLLLYPMMANFVLMACLMPFVYKPLPITELGGLALMSLLAFVASSLLIAAYKAGEAVIVAPMQYSQIIWASLFSVFFFNEIPDARTAIGAAIIISSGLYIVLREGRSGSDSERPVLRTRSRIETGTSPRISSALRREKRKDETTD